MPSLETATLFSPARPGRASEDVALQIEAAITDGSIMPGQSLPSERELQAQFRTSRGVVREALRALKQKGLLEIRKGAHGGAYVKAVGVDNVSESLALFLKQRQVSPARLIEFRETVDRALIVMAVARATQADMRELADLADALAAAAGGDAPDLDLVAERDRECNLALARMADNPVFEWIMRAVQLGFSSLDMALYEDPDCRERTVANWRDTARAIAAREPLAALSHVSLHYAWLRRRLGKSGSSDADRKDKEQT
ncbi:MAG: FadR/GntR family transcriptional regulator [Desulfovibrio sp.]